MIIVRGARSNYRTRWKDPAWTVDLRARVRMVTKGADPARTMGQERGVYSCPSGKPRTSDDDDYYLCNSIHSEGVLVVPSLVRSTTRMQCAGGGDCDSLQAVTIRRNSGVRRGWETMRMGSRRGGMKGTTTPPLLCPTMHALLHARTEYYHLQSKRRTGRELSLSFCLSASGARGDQNNNNNKSPRVMTEDRGHPHPRKMKRVTLCWPYLLLIIY